MLCEGSWGCVFLVRSVTCVGALREEGYACLVCVKVGIR